MHPVTALSSRAVSYGVRTITKSRWSMRAVVSAAVTVSVVGLAAASAAQATPTMRGGIFDDALTRSTGATLDSAFVRYRDLGVRVVRVMLRWDQVAASRPLEPTNPNSYPPAAWAPYDEAVRRAAASIPPIQILLNIYGTPSWANGGRSYLYAPGGTALRAFAMAAATRYSGNFDDPLRPGEKLPRVLFWAAWNEPNLPTFLRPQWRRVNGRWVSNAPRLYARICNQIVGGVHAAQSTLAGEVVACGLTSPRGGGRPGVRSSSHTPLALLRGIKKHGARFDVYAHHPHSLTHPPTWKPPRGSSWITLGNIGKLTTVLTSLYGRKKLWVTEFGYETRPPDSLVGVSYARQAGWLSQAYGIARRNSRISMFIWFLLRDEADRNGAAFGVPGWQSGLFRTTADLANPATAKPAYATFKNLLH
jgi:hypothetical protein